MPDVTITIPNAVVPRIRSAWDARFNQEEGETDIELFKRGLLRMIREEVLRHEARQERASKMQEQMGIADPPPEEVQT